MKSETPFLTDQFLLQSNVAERLYFEYAESLPIIDYHNHLPPDQIADNHQFENLTQIWLDGDHYKWRAMRAMGIDEKFITGQASDQDKFMKWAATVPHTLRNPLFHWTHMELKKPFGINRLLNTKTATAIYESANKLLQTPAFSVQSILTKMNVEVVCTTDDPIDNLVDHRRFSQQNGAIKMFPAWRPDKAMAVEHTATFMDYVNQLSNITGVEITDIDGYMEALSKRHDYFHTNGCRLADHGISCMVFKSFTAADVAHNFKKLLAGQQLTDNQIDQLKSYFLLEFGRLNHAKGWVQQFHIGALRNNNHRMYRQLGPNMGFDSIGDVPQAQQLSNYLDALDQTNQLTKTILYNLNPADNEMMAAMAGNFNDGTVKGKMQYGSAWWFLDQLDGMEKQLNALSNIGLLSCFIGMLTDSRSFLSFTRHEYFRRLLCNMLANDIKKGLIPEDYQWVGNMIQNICYNNAKAYFEFI